MDRVTITGIELMSPPHETTIGHEIIAYFAADLGPVRIKGCALVKKTSGKMAAWLPNLHDKKARNNRSVALIRQADSDALLEAALQTYRQMGGTEAPERNSIDRAEQALADILPPPVQRDPLGTRVAVPVTRRTKEPSE